ncbi:hypothetical protein BLNAU_9855 [Blattamonas nauphoetae]|uniref:Uncharacterized protein n=1 Tax=Blattamonas nauphoetae TaxID=2049346 RepID=A0ABQ9XUI5_9EUKA|nr:hypothetical protein BLNAU_9855 [Blattamonas nauphoetae]
MSSGISSSIHISEQSPSDPAAFVNWDEEPLESKSDILSLCRSLISMLKAGHSLDNRLKNKVKLLLNQFLDTCDEGDSDRFIPGFVPSPIDEFLSEFVTSIIVLLPTAHKEIGTTMMDMLEFLIQYCLYIFRLNLVKADLIPHLITHLNPLSLSFTDSQEIHSHLTSIISSSIWLATQFGLRNLQIKDWNEQQNIHETVFNQVLVPSEPYIRHLCVNSRTIADRDQSSHFMQILGFLLRICPFYQPTLDFVRNLPIITTIPLALSSSVKEPSIWQFLFESTSAQEEWNEKGGDIRQTGKAVHGCLKSEVSVANSVVVELRAAELAISQLTILKRALNPVVFLEADKSAGDADADRRHDVPRALLGTLNIVVCFSSHPKCRSLRRTERDKRMWLCCPPALCKHCRPSVQYAQHGMLTTKQQAMCQIIEHATPSHSLRSCDDCA